MDFRGTPAKIIVKIPSGVLMNTAGSPNHN